MSATTAMAESSIPTALRTRIVGAIPVHFMLDRVVRLVVVVLRLLNIPTGHSPDTEDDLSLHIAAWVISEAGEGNVGIVFNSINSYGQSSPDTNCNDIPQRSYRVYRNGDIDEEHAEVLFSYGHKNTGVKS